MEIRSVSLADFRRITERVSADKYNGNVILDGNERPLGAKAQSCRARLRVQSSSGPGARRSWRGRRLVAACYDAYFDVMKAVFDEFPHATIVSTFETFRGQDDFLDKFEGVRYRNVGSMMQPAYYGDLCTNC